MALTSFALGMFFLGQISPPQAAAQGNASLAAADATKRSPAAELLAEVLPPPEQQALAGRELSLVKALAGTSDRRHRHEITRAYWRLSLAVSACHLAADQSVLLDRIGAPKEDTHRQLPPEEQQALAAARESAKAMWAEAELQAIESQHALADRLGWPLGEPLPLPADRPHLGSYQTKFDLLFANRQPPVRTRMIDRTLPIRREAIEARAAAVQAARDALDVVVESYQSGQTSLDRALNAASGVDRQRRFFLAAVEQYNLDIAEYVSAVAREGTNENEFVAMLIRSQPAAPAAKGHAGWQPGFSTPRDRATPATYDAPAAAETPSNTPLLRTSPPSLIAPDAEAAREAIGDREPETNPQSAIPNPQFPRHAFRQPFSDGLRYNPSAARSSRAGGPDRPMAMYAGLQKLSPLERQRQLAASLHWDQNPPEPDRLPISLEAFLKDVPIPGRGPALAAYWHTREQAAWVQVLGQQAERIDEMVSPLFELREQPNCASAMLRLQSAHLAAQADLLDARAALFGSQAELMQWAPEAASPTGRKGSGVDLGHCAQPIEGSLAEIDSRPLSRDTWWWPETQPQAGGYPAEFAGIEQWQRSSRLHQRLSLRLPALEGVLADHAAGVISSDAARAIHAQKFAADPLALDELLAAMESQTAQTQAFLSAVTRFNLAVSAYALAVLPAKASSESLSLALLRGPAAAL